MGGGWGGGVWAGGVGGGGGGGGGGCVVGLEGGRRSFVESIERRLYHKG